MNSLSPERPRVSVCVLRSFEEERFAAVSSSQSFDLRYPSPCCLWIHKVSETECLLACLQEPIRPSIPALHILVWCPLRFNRIDQRNQMSHALSEFIGFVTKNKLLCAEALAAESMGLDSTLKYGLSIMQLDLSSSFNIYFPLIKRALLAKEIYVNNLTCTKAETSWFSFHLLY